ncbi:DUF6252 family protein [Flavobacterium sp. RHBU_24]|uniref:DUF6252 family protein n=1 Tax=Flavobacterium sp. RHBU_24 TaxID=3391185 RepID=UPI003984B7BD
MKKIKLLSAFFVLFTAIGFVSCDTEPVDPLLVNENPNEPQPASFEVDFNNQTYQATTVQASVINNSIIISAVRADGATFMITVPGTTTGEYTNATILYTPAIGGTVVYANDSEEGLNGSVTLTTINTTTHTITGIFDFTGIAEGQPDIEFSDGIFTNITYTGTIIPVEPAGDPLFTVKIDGVEYVADSYHATIGNGLITVTGLRGNNGEYVSLVLEGTTEGEYPESILAYSPDGDEDNVYSNISFDEEDTDIGSVTISEINTAAHTISGTFHFTGYLEGAADKSLTEGTFENIPYTDENTTPTEDEFTATVDDTDYTYAGADLIVALANDDQINMQAFGDGHKIRLFLNNPTEGSYAFSTEIGAPAQAWFTDAEGVEHDINNGSILVTHIDEFRIEGTFSYDVLDDSGEVIHTVTDGVFNVEYNW